MKKIERFNLNWGKMSSAKDGMWISFEDAAESAEQYANYTENEGLKLINKQVDILEKHITSMVIESKKSTELLEETYNNVHIIGKKLGSLIVILYAVILVETGIIFSSVI